MNINAFPSAPPAQNNTLESVKQKTETIAERRMAVSKETAKVFKKHDEAKPELEQIYFREKLAKSGPEVAIGGLESKIGAAEIQVNNFAEKGDPIQERIWADRVADLTDMLNIFCRYLDWKEKYHPDLVKYYTDMHPWVLTELEEAEKIRAQEKEEEIEVEFDVPQKYQSQDTGLQQAA